MINVLVDVIFNMFVFYDEVVKKVVFVFVDKWEVSVDGFMYMFYLCLNVVF